MNAVLEVLEERLADLKRRGGKRYDDPLHNKILIAMAYELNRTIFIIKHGRPPTVQDTKDEIAAMRT